GVVIAIFDSLALCTGHKLAKREEAFDLAKIEIEFKENEEQRGFNRTVFEKRKFLGGFLRRDSVPSEEKCQEKCNDDLRSGLDMVKVGFLVESLNPEIGSIFQNFQIGGSSTRKFFLYSSDQFFNFQAHTAFGSIGVPSVIDRLDLIMFCRLD